MMWKSLILAVCLSGALASDDDDIIVGSTLVVENMWMNILERVDRYILPPTAFFYDDLQPHIDEKTLQDHHIGEQNLMKSALNWKLGQWKKEEPDNKLARESILHILQNLDKVNEKYSSEIRFFGGGFINHCFYFGLLTGNEEGTERAPTGALAEEINQNFGSLEKLKEEVAAAVKSLRGSGWVWVTRLPGKTGEGALKVTTSNNHDSPVLAGMWPIVALDMWEHAYYLKHGYKKWEHLSDFWMVLDWEKVALLDKFWHEQDKEQTAADKRIEELTASLKKQAAARNTKSSGESSEKAKKTGKEDKTEL